MGRKSVPFVRESSLLRLRLSDVLDDENSAFSLADADDDDDDDEVVMTAVQAGAPAGVTLEDLYRRNRVRARLVGLLHTHRAFHGAPIIVLADNDAEQDCPEDESAMALFVKPIDRDQLVNAALRLVH